MNNYRKKPWSQDEDAQLVRLVDRHGPEKWSTIAAEIVNRTGKQCRERWHNHLHPGIRKGPWTQQ
jgi:hypothetical protein